MSRLGPNGAFFTAFVSGSVFVAFDSDSVFAAFGSGTGRELISSCSGCGGGSGCGFSSSGGFDTPVLVSDGLLCVFGVLTGIDGASSPA